MRYSKTHVNEIVDQVVEVFNEAINNQQVVDEHALEMIKEEHRLIDRRKSSIPEYRTEILRDFMEMKFSYKELMKKYHCSMRTVRSLLLECAEDDDRVYAEIEFRRH
ncbi:MAG: hypothetical protein JRD93_17560 [Deltaproteobacteria bacterium]|nr:hypothetical protein [Deltaproteobacteria bacterium]